MFTQNRSKRGYRTLMAVLFIGVLAAALVNVQPAQAHCDSEQGPVAMAAHQALKTGNIKLVLPYVKPDAEAELTATFKQALEVRKAGGEAQKLADRYFIEAAVRLHRAGEGAPYNGLTDKSTPEAILIADMVMATGSLDGAYSFLDQALWEGMQDKYDAVVKAREEAEELGTVEAHRERVEAELEFEKYIYELWGLASGDAGHAAEGEGH